MRLTRDQVREVDRLAIGEYGIPGVVLMENARRNAAAIILERSAPLLARQRLPRGVSQPQGSLLTEQWHAHEGGSAAIVCGGGNNGGDGFVIARHLANVGASVSIFLACDAARLTGDAAVNFHIVERMGIRRIAFDTQERIAASAPILRNAAVIVDALLGTGFSGQVRAPLDLVIRAINEAASSRHPVVIAVDLPSGLDCDSGQPSNATVRADETITFVARKVGFDAPAAAGYLGRVHVADIGVPRGLIEEVARGG